MQSSLNNQNTTILEGYFNGRNNKKLTSGSENMGHNFLILNRNICFWSIDTFMSELVDLEKCEKIISFRIHIMYVR